MKPLSGLVTGEVTDLEFLNGMKIRQLFQGNVGAAAQGNVRIDQPIRLLGVMTLLRASLNQLSSAEFILGDTVNGANYIPLVSELISGSASFALYKTRFFSIDLSLPSDTYLGFYAQTTGGSAAVAILYQDLQLQPNVIERPDIPPPVPPSPCGILDFIGGGCVRA